MNTQMKRTYEFTSSKQLTVSDLRSLVEWLDHLGLGEDQVVDVLAHEGQRDGYYFVAKVSIHDASSPVQR